ALMVGPAAAAQRLTARLGPGIALAAALALAAAWAGLTASFYTDWPSSFWITTFGAGVYLVTGV
ncbi:MAG TPA: metal ABC transporter permease, partial [Acetobacteraceae bacterium]|nr:metal ABC transporter permease [Acetobacteraceae bacterium]